MQELIDMLRTMAAACKSVVQEYPVGIAQAVQNVNSGGLPGIRFGVHDGYMIRIIIERSNNSANSESRTAEADAWNSLWIDPERQRETEP